MIDDLFPSHLTGLRVCAGRHYTGLGLYLMAGRLAGREGRRGHKGPTSMVKWSVERQGEHSMPIDKRGTSCHKTVSVT